jgi:hypothetical protein
MVRIPRQLDRLADSGSAKLQVTQQVVVHHVASVLIDFRPRSQSPQLEAVDKRFSKAANSRSKSANVFAPQSYHLLLAARREFSETV